MSAGTPGRTETNEDFLDGALTFTRIDPATFPGSEDSVLLTVRGKDHSLTYEDVLDLQAHLEVLSEDMRAWRLSPESEEDQ